jgi:hypothetical protein
MVFYRYECGCVATATACYHGGLGERVPVIRIVDCRSEDGLYRIERVRVNTPAYDDLERKDRECLSVNDQIDIWDSIGGLVDDGHNARELARMLRAIGV